MSDDPFLTYLENTITRMDHLRRREQEKIDLAIAMRTRHEAEIEALQEALAVYQSHVKALGET